MFDYNQARNLRSSELKSGICLCLLVSVFTLAAHSAKAESSDGGKLFMGCDIENVLRLNYQDITQRSLPNNTSVKTNYEKIDINSLIKYADESKKEFSTRIGSMVVKRICGPFQVEISAGYFNSNPQGENGGEDPFPVVSVFYDKQVLVDNLNLGYCESGQARYTDCSVKWAAEVRILLMRETQLPDGSILNGRIQREIVRVSREQSDIVVPK